MQVSIENVGKLERRLTVSVPAERLESQVSSRLSTMTRTLRLNGFRPGKVPRKVVEQRFGLQVRNEAVSELIRNSFDEVLRSQNLRPVAPPSIETTGAAEGGEFRFTATFEVLPEIGAIDVSGLQVVRPLAEVQDADVDRMIETLRLQRRTWVEVQRPAQLGDLVVFESIAVAGQQRVPAEGVERSGTILGSSAVLPEIETALVGVPANGETTISVAFAADHRDAAFAGKEVSIQLKSVRVSEGSLPEVDDAFMSAFGVSTGGIERFRTEVRANLERELRGALMARLKNDVVGKILAAHPDLEVPSRMIQTEANGLARQAEQQAKSQGQTLSADPQTYLPMARQRVAVAVLLGELARQNEIRLDRSRLNSMLASIASTYEEPQQVMDLYHSDEQMMRGLENRVIEDQVIDWIADHASLKVQNLSFADVMRPG